MKREVLNAFKRLHRARQAVFQGDEHALTEGRFMINDHFRKNKAVEDKEEIKKLIQLAVDAEKELRTNVIQAVKKTEGIYQLRITEDTTKLDNVSFDPYAIPPDVTRKSAEFKCCRGPEFDCHSVTDQSERKV